MASTASTNLSFLYFLQGDNDAAENYAELAKDTDSYNAAAFVNLGKFATKMLFTGWPIRSSTVFC